ncbi:MAG: acyl-CoA dehydrogenase [Methylibium sp.]
MWQYVPPWRDMRFVIEELLDLPARWATMSAFDAVDAEVARQVIDGAGRFASQVLAPINAGGDLEGCTWHDGDVRSPAGFRQAYAAFVEAGWPTLACDVDCGGQGLPQVLNSVLYEMLVGANHAWTMAPGLLHGAYECLRRHAAPELRERYLAKVVSGEWLATMCLTEAQAGSDLGRVATRAVPQGDGSFSIDGQKIFISGGEHDLTDNIVHLVLARLQDPLQGPAPAGSRGLSLFVAPKWLDDGSRNGIFCDGIEKKMGIKGSPTCVMRFDGARGWLVGEPHRGLAAMFAMMNSARVHVGLQGLGHAEAAWQNALRYANERVQSRAPGLAAVSTGVIAEHPAVQRLLWSLRVRVEAARVLAYEASHLIDVSEHGDDPAQAGRARQIASLLTPVVKAVLTHNGFQAASDALQVWGGHGYIHDFGIEQTLRDSRIAMIYEGTNEIQAIDLLARKGVADGGHALAALYDWVEGALPPACRHGETVRRCIGELRRITGDLIEAASTDPQLAYRAADDFMHALGLLLFAQGFARADAVAERALAAATEEPDFYADKRAAASWFMQRELPEFTRRLELLRGAGRPWAQPVMG